MGFSARLGRFWGFWGEVFRSYGRDNGSIAAAAVSFYAFLSLIPLLLLALAIVGYILGSPEHARKVVFGYLDQYWPKVASEGMIGVRDVVREVIEQRGAATGVAVLGLLWTGISTMTTLEAAINLAWNVEVRRNWLTKRLAAFAVFICVGLLLGASVGATAAVRAGERMQVGWPWVFSFLGYLLPVVVSVAAFTLIYKFLPNTRVPTTSALLGGVFAGILWELAKVGFSFYAAHFGEFSRIYGSLGGIILLAVWINFSSIVAILGAEVASSHLRR